MQARLLAATLLVAGAALPGRAFASCADAPEVFVTDVSRTFANNARWDFQVIRKKCEGLVIASAFYRPALTAPSWQVLNRGNIAEIHVPFATGSPRNFEVTSTNEGLGDTDPAGKSFAVPLTTTECEGPGPNGPSLFDGNRVCVMNEDGDLRHRYYEDYRLGQRVVVFMSTQVEKENYINRWEFNDDGSIEVSLGITGQVPLTKSSTSYNSYGARLDKSSNATPRIGLAHQHNVYYRLDFDLNGPANDLVSRRTFAPSTAPGPDTRTTCSISGECGVVTITPVTTEAAQTWSPSAQTTWIITDKVATNLEGRNIGYELIPELSGLWRGMTSSSEPWSGSEVWVTKYNGCELFAAKNTGPALPSSCGTGNKGDVQAMVNGESVNGADLVVWYANRMLHVPRDEDETNMPIRWMSFELAPRNLHHESTLAP